jgi:DNA-binding LacI/PurR family transcriptional regulator
MSRVLIIPHFVSGGHPTSPNRRTRPRRDSKIRVMSVAIDACEGVQDQFSVGGFDDVTLAAHVRPAFTTVPQDAIDSGRAAALSFVAVIQGERLPAATPTPATVVRRSSTSAPRLERRTID